MTRKLDALRQIEFGERVAEEEADHLDRYFLETDQWNKILRGDIDVVYGPKGSGKSALYTLLNKKEGDLFDRGVLLAPAENIRGTTVFKTIVDNPLASELSFVYLWKIYSLSIIAKALRSYSVNNKFSVSLIKSLEKVGILPITDSLTTLFRAVTTYIRSWLARDAKAVKYALTIDSVTGTPTFSRKIEFSDKSERQNLDDIPIEELFEIANRALECGNLSVWLLFDRLDVAFSESLELERNALRALFRTYLDIKAYEKIQLKIFVRDDIWQRITSGGFTEASHITKSVHILWSEESLLNLVMLRLLSNEALTEYAKIDPEDVKADYTKQYNLFYELAPEQVDTGKNPSTFNWILSRTADSSKKNVPREVIHLLEVTKEIQIQKLERGGEEPVDNQLFDRSSFKDALPTVSRVRFEQTLLAEYPEMQEHLLKLKDGKAEQPLASLCEIWKTDDKKTRLIARQLTEIGFFEARGSKEEPTYWVPFIYRNALNLVQGKADAP